jgi:hypothetical protein
MPPLIRLDTSTATLARASTVHRRRSSGASSLFSPQHNPPPADQPTSPTLSPIRRLARTLSTKVVPLTLPLRRRSTKRNEEYQLADVESGGESSGDAKKRIVKIAPIDQFRNVVRRVIHMNRMRTLTDGEDPGLDARKMSTYQLYGARTEHCSIDIIDFGPAKVNFSRLNNSTLEAALKAKRGNYAKLRWINVTGVSWDVISMLALEYSEWSYREGVSGLPATVQICTHLP